MKFLLIMLGATMAAAHMGISSPRPLDQAVGDPYRYPVSSDNNIQNGGACHGQGAGARYAWVWTPNLSGTCEIYQNCFVDRPGTMTMSFGASHGGGKCKLYECTGQITLPNCVRTVLPSSFGTCTEVASTDDCTLLGSMEGGGGGSVPTARPPTPRPTLPQPTPDPTPRPSTAEPTPRPTAFGTTPKPTPDPTPIPTARPTPPTARPTARPTTANGACGSCQGCMWDAVGPAMGCYRDWTKPICDRHAGYTWCSGAGSPTPRPTVTVTPEPTANPPTVIPEQPTPQPTATPEQPTPQPTVTPGGNCGSCQGCLWVAYGACYQDWPQSTCQFYSSSGYQWCDAGATPTPQPTNPFTDPPTASPPPTEGKDECVTHAQLMAINGESSFWPGCDPSQPAKGSATGYDFGYYCTQEWVNELNEMLSELGYCDDQQIIRHFLAQAAYETGYYSTLGQPADSGSGMIHMIPANWDLNVRDMEIVFPNQGLQAAYQDSADKKQFFKLPQYAWKSVAAWFKLTNRVIGGCAKDLFAEPYTEQTRCILGRYTDRAEALNIVQKHV